VLLQPCMRFRCGIELDLESEDGMVVNGCVGNTTGR
jgi:hypothetical protein